MKYTGTVQLNDTERFSLQSDAHGFPKLSVNYATEPSSLQSDAHSFPKLPVNYWSHRLFVSMLHRLQLVSYFLQKPNSVQSPAGSVSLFVPWCFSFVHLKMTNAYSLLKGKRKSSVWYTRIVRIHSKRKLWPLHN